MSDWDDAAFISVQVPQPRQPDGFCRNCQKRPATTFWVGEGGALAYVHGGGVPWCMRCTVEAQLKYAREQAARIPELEQQLKRLQ